MAYLVSGNYTGDSRVFLISLCNHFFAGNVFFSLKLSRVYFYTHFKTPRRGLKNTPDGDLFSPAFFANIAVDGTGHRDAPQYAVTVTYRISFR